MAFSLFCIPRCGILYSKLSRKRIGVSFHLSFWHLREPGMSGVSPGLNLRTCHLIPFYYLLYCLFSCSSAYSHCSLLTKPKLTETQCTIPILRLISLEIFVTKVAFVVFVFMAKARSLQELQEDTSKYYRLGSVLSKYLLKTFAQSHIYNHRNWSVLAESK